MSHGLQWYAKQRTVPVPATPEAPVVSNLTANGVTLSWTLIPTTTFYTLERSTDALSWSVVHQGSDLSFDDTGLSASSLYYYRLQASSGVGDSDYSENAIVTLDTSTPPDTPAAPTLDSVATTTASLSWAAVALATSYTLERSTSPTTGFTTAFTGSALSFIDSGLTAGTTYYYRLKASNADGTSAASANTTATTTGAPTVPATPAQPAASNVGSSSVNISWVAVSGATDYELQQRQTAGVGSGLPTAFATIYGPGPQLTFQVTGLNASSTYEFKVRAMNSAGASAYSVVRIITTGSTSGTNVQPISMVAFRKMNGVATHPNFNQPSKVWKTANAAEYIDLIFQGGWGYIRGSYANPDVFLPLLRARKMGWIAGIVGEASGGGVTPPTNDTVAQTRATVRAIRENAADVIIGLEGINEPNQNRGGGTTVSNWAQITVNHQQAIWQEAKWNLLSVNGPIGNSPTQGSVPNPLRNATIYSPSLHDIACEDSYSNNPPNDTGPRHWHQLVDLGILSFQEAEGMHTYPGAGIPLRGTRSQALLNDGISNAEGGNVTGRLELMWSANGTNYPAMTTEWGYHNALAQTGGHEPIDERGAGIYYPRGCIQLPTTPYRIGGVGLTNNLACTGFEFLDDQDDGPDVNYPQVGGGTGSSQKTSQELNFGIYGYNRNTDNLDPANWRPKPAYTKTKALLTHGGREPLDQPDFVPTRVKLDVTTSANNDLLEWQVFATKAMSDAGKAFVAIYRRNRVWTRGGKTDTGVPVNVPTIPVTITDRVGVLGTFQIGADVELIDLR